ncbi:hypothetical protein BKA93DRAFT_554994 [Sparassis latifolia]
MVCESLPNHAFTICHVGGTSICKILVPFGRAVTLKFLKCERTNYSHIVGWRPILRSSARPARILQSLVRNYRMTYEVPFGSFTYAWPMSESIMHVAGYFAYLPAPMKVACIPAFEAFVVRLRGIEPRYFVLIMVLGYMCPNVFSLWDF